MKEESVYSELSSIRSLMERSSKFISLSGLSGVMAGVYALAGAFFAQSLIQQQEKSTGDGGEYAIHSSIVPQLTLMAIAVLLLSITTCVILSLRQSRKKGEASWTKGSKRLLTSISVPLVTGGIFVAILLLRAE